MRRLQLLLFVREILILRLQHRCLPLHPSLAVLLVLLSTVTVAGNLCILVAHTLGIMLKTTVKIWEEIWHQSTMKANSFLYRISFHPILEIFGLEEVMLLWRVAGCGLMEVTGVMKIGFQANLTQEQVKTV